MDTTFHLLIYFTWSFSSQLYQKEAENEEEPEQVSGDDAGEQSDEETRVSISQSLHSFGKKLHTNFICF